MNYDIETLLKLKQDLDAETDVINKRIIEFQNDLKKLGMGVTAWVKISPNTELGYTRRDGDWKIVVHYDDYGTDLRMPALDCNRGLRLHTVKHMHKLLPAIEEEAKRLLERMKRVDEDDQ
jgi:hypothetical protein